jgi:hypothetical protein
MDGLRESWSAAGGVELPAQDGERFETGALADDFRSYLSSLEHEVRCQAMHAGKEGTTAARATKFAAQVFAEAEEGSSGRTSARSVRTHERERGEEG